MWLLPFNWLRSIQSMLITNLDYKTQSILSAYHVPELNIWSKLQGLPNIFLITKNREVEERRQMNDFPWWVQKISPRTHILHVKISSRKTKFETLYPNDIIKLEIIKEIVILCLLNHVFTKINKNLKDLQRNTFWSGVTVHWCTSLTHDIHSPAHPKTVLEWEC